MTGRGDGAMIVMLWEKVERGRGQSRGGRGGGTGQLIVEVFSWRLTVTPAFIGIDVNHTKYFTALFLLHCSQKPLHCNRDR